MKKEERMKDEEEQGQMNDQGIENLCLYAPASASTLDPVLLALILRHVMW